MDKFKVLFLSSSSRYSIPEPREHIVKKYTELSKLADINVMAVSADGKRKTGIIEGSKFYLVPNLKIGPIDALLYVVYSTLDGLRINKNKKVDIIYPQTGFIDGLVALFLKKVIGAKMIVGVHGDWEMEIMYSKPHVYRFMPLLNLSVRFVLKNADCIRAISKATKKKALEFVREDKICPTMFPAFFDAEFFLKDEPVESKENSVVFVGSLIGRKGIDYLIQAVPHVVKSFKDFKLYIVGEGKLKSYLMDLASELGVEDYVIFTDHLSAEEVKEYIDKSRALLLPSLSEGLGRIVLEAMARGKPVIGSNVEGIKESIKDGSNGVLVEPRDVDGIANAVIYVLKNKEGSRKMGLEGRKFVMRTYSMERYKENYKKLFKFALASDVR